MSTVIIIQARVGSTRLPNKVLTDIANKPMLQRVVERCSRSTNADTVMVATTNNADDDPIVKLCESIGTPVYRGSEEDVLDRYKQAADMIQADVIVRVTSDCPLIDPEILDQAITKFEEVKPDYASNVIERTYPRGLDCEIFSRSVLDRVWNEAKQKHEREHVTPYILENPEKFTVLSIVGDTNESTHRWTVDTPEDLKLVQAIYAELGEDGAFDWKQILDFLEQNPEILQLNAGIEQKSLKD
ncbi:MAG: acylneuraminate cytidylyltransferase [Flammeovirgaceae bacterium]|nr:acylneuraminate cytidylyltransferase [Flammeovirgaceae bacterium]|tara:strand:- start:2146 stop:2874 length:729 start_codon:yes stop_codon:yes gene_type:complete